MESTLSLEKFDAWSMLAPMLAPMLVGLVTVCMVCYCSSRKTESNFQEPKLAARKPESVNYHFTRQCNYECGFCFHTAKTSFVLPLAEAKRGLKILNDAG